jgi:hypothetical protein
MNAFLPKPTKSIITDVSSLLYAGSLYFRTAFYHEPNLTAKHYEIFDENISSEDIMKLAEASGSFDFLKDEPDIYTDDDVKPENQNPQFKPK